MSVQDAISNYWQILFVAPLGFVAHKVFSLNAKVSVHDAEIATLKDTCNNLCQQSQKQIELLSDISGQLKEHLRNSTPR